jgi:hypothetical protein
MPSPSHQALTLPFWISGQTPHWSGMHPPGCLHARAFPGKVCKARISACNACPAVRRPHGSK